MSTPERAASADADAAPAPDAAAAAASAAAAAVAAASAADGALPDDDVGGDDAGGDDDGGDAQVEMLQALSLQERVGETAPPPAPPDGGAAASTAAAVLKALQRQGAASASASVGTDVGTGDGAAAGADAGTGAGAVAGKRGHEFWSTQPVVQPGDRADAANLAPGPVVPDKSPDELEKEPYKLVAGYEWCVISVGEEASAGTASSSASASGSGSASASASASSSASAGKAAGGTGGKDSSSSGGDSGGGSSAAEGEPGGGREAGAAAAAAGAGAAVSPPAPPRDQLGEMYDLLANNYVEDDDHMFRFAYSRDFLKWALSPPGYQHAWHVGVRASKSQKLVACISGVPADVVVHDTSVRLCEIDFLCVDKRLRSKRLAPLLIKEVTRRVNLAGVFQATYTAGVVLPGSVSSCRYWHRSLQPAKLVDVGFSHLPRGMTMNRLVRDNRLAESPHTPGLRALEPRDVPQACAGLNSYLAKFKLRPRFSEAEFAHYFLPRDRVVDAFVVEAMAEDGSGEPTGRVTCMVSFYHLPSSIMGNPRHKTINAAYLFYYFAGGGVPLRQLIEDCLICARNCGVDVLNCLDLMDNRAFLKELKFGMGDGLLQYYLYNFRSPLIAPQDVGLILL